MAPSVADEERRRAIFIASDVGKFFGDAELRQFLGKVLCELARSEITCG